MPFELRVDEVSESTARWTSTGAFPPHWTNSAVSWRVAANPQGEGVVIDFMHRNFPTEEGIGMVAYTWGQLMTSLKHYVESGEAAPLFTS